MSLDRVRQALEIGLFTMTPAIDTSWENQDFKPDPAKPYQEVTLLPARPDNSTLGDAHYRERGIFQVTLKYPIGKSTKDVMTRAKLLRATFDRGTSFTSGGLTTRIETTPEIGRGTVVKDRYELPVSIRYFADVF
jgi:hypothetical protein